MIRGDPGKFPQGSRLVRDRPIPHYALQIPDSPVTFYSQLFLKLVYDLYTILFKAPLIEIKYVNISLCTRIFKT